MSADIDEPRRAGGQPHERSGYTRPAMRHVVRVRANRGIEQFEASWFEVARAFDAGMRFALSYPEAARRELRHEPQPSACDEVEQPRAPAVTAHDGAGEKAGGDYGNF